MYKGYDGERVQIAFYAPSVSPTSTIPTMSPVEIFWDAGTIRSTKTPTFNSRVYYDRTSQLSPQLDEMRNTLDIDFLYHLKPNERHDLLFGAGARWSPDSITQKFDTLDFVPHQETDSIYSWFLQDQISLIPDGFLSSSGPSSSTTTIVASRSSRTSVRSGRQQTISRSGWR